MKTYIVQLESHDDALSTRDKMAWSKAPRILLVWPRKGRVLDRAVDLMILQRHANILGAQLGVVTADGDVRANASDLGIPSFSSAVEAQRGSWRKPRSARKPNWRNMVVRRNPADLRRQREELRAAPFDDRWTRLAAFSLGILAVAVMALFFLPAATIELTPQRQEQALTLQAWASPDIREANPSGGMPAFTISAVVEGSVQVPSSGSVGIPETQASGEVEISNLTDQEILLPVGTVVLARGQGDNVLRFTTTRAARLQAGIDQKTVVLVQAQIPGIEGNIRAGTVEAVEGAVGLSVLVTNPKAFSGGSDRSSLAPQVSDYQKAEDELKQSLRTSALEDMRRNLSADQRLVPGTLVVSKVLADTREPAAGQPGDFARLSQQVEFTAWYVNQSDLTAVARTALDANQSSGFQPLAESLQIDFAEDAKFDENGVARWDMEVSRQLESVWSEPQAAQAVVGRSPAEAAQILEKMIALSAPAQVHLNPSWWVRMPFLAFRIAVVRR